MKGIPKTYQHILFLVNIFVAVVVSSIALAILIDMAGFTGIKQSILECHNLPEDRLHRDVFMDEELTKLFPEKIGIFLIFLSFSGLYMWWIRPKRLNLNKEM